MSLVIRLRQQGRKNKRMFRLVVADKRSPRDGKYVENLGHYNPHAAENNAVIHTEKVEEWIGKGAKPSERVITLLKKLSPNTLKLLRK